MYNGHGDVVALNDATGNVVATYDYDEWGNITSQTGNIDSPFTYAGQFGYVHDKETGLYFLKSRYYDAEIGRFTTRDRFKGFENRPTSQNAYTYTENDPVNAVDPSGNFPWRLVWDWLTFIFGIVCMILGGWWWFPSLLVGLGTIAWDLYTGYYWRHYRRWKLVQYLALDIGSLLPWGLGIAVSKASALLDTITYALNKVGYYY